MSEHIHTHDDGRGPRHVFVNDRRVEGVFYADTLAGFVRAYYQPPRANRREDGARWRKIRGSVVMVPYE